MEKNHIIEELQAIAKMDWGNPDQKAYYEQRAKDAARIYTMARDLFARNKEIAQKAFDRWKKEHQN